MINYGKGNGDRFEWRVLDNRKFDRRDSQGFFSYSIDRGRGTYLYNKWFLVTRQSLPHQQRYEAPGGTQ